MIPAVNDMGTAVLSAATVCVAVVGAAKLIQTVCQVAGRALQQGYREGSNWAFKQGVWSKDSAASAEATGARAEAWKATEANMWTMGCAVGMIATAQIANGLFGLFTSSPSVAGFSNWTGVAPHSSSMARWAVTSGISWLPVAAE